ncbi:MAG: hypothetical protein IK145_08720 [Bacteroidales bacterium]|mgnify:FL=1|jgi:hypothetical protein|nr:hypothetical protein [Bacteroidales bacterium]MBQ5411247.1 hypothetical protein [Bacteroidales bacterium]MBQ5486561.1 hypothetical protein [Bacteroidales bacterium]MBQ6301058.1 hypothetical protein [Bacteroidales bacterium]MBR5397917.1 hypothetical protein [Bacteroidales bacterium]
MDKSKVFAFIAALAIFVGCASTKSLPERFDSFVEKTENEFKDYTEADWEKSRQEYEGFVQEIKDNYDSYSTSEKVKMAEAIGRYNSILIQNGVGSATESIGDLIDQIPDVINDAIKNIDTVAIKQSMDNLGNTIEGIINSIDTAAIRKSVEGIVGSVDTARLRESIENMSKSIDTAEFRKKVEGIVNSIDTARLRQKLEAVIKIFGGDK